MGRRENLTERKKERKKDWEDRKTKRTNFKKNREK